MGLTSALLSEIDDIYLLETFGDKYRQFQKEVPMLIPYKIPRQNIG